MEETIAIGIILALVVLVIVSMGSMFFHTVLPGIYYGLAMSLVYVFYQLDRLFSVQCFPHLPWLMWGIWGGLFGAALAFWPVAPRYGLRAWRVWILCAPLLLMFAVMLLCSIARALG